jgi:Zn ribbon nucleic-acid-binding protein
MTRLRVLAVFRCPRCAADLKRALNIAPAELARRCRSGGGTMPRCLACGHAGRGLADFLQIDPSTLEVVDAPAPPPAPRPRTPRRIG